MKRIQTWSLEKIARAMGGALLIEGEGAGLAITGVSTDTRRIFDGALFVALVGVNFDAHAFVARAAAEGAVAAVVSRLVDVPPGFALILVEDTLEALSTLGHGLWREATEGGMHTIAVTGSNGKTTTKELLAALWSAQGEVWATQGNLNNHIGVPLTLVDLPLSCDTLIAEMGANAPGDIADLVKLAPGQTRIVTSIGIAHLEGFGSLDGVRRTKGEIFSGADETTAAVVPVNEMENLLERDFPGSVWTVGLADGQGPAPRVRLVEAVPDGAGGQEVTLEVDSRKWTLSLPLPGVHNALNLGTALATLLAAGIDPDEGRLDAVLGGLTLPQGRWRLVRVGELSIIDDAYNANPSSVRASFEAFIALPKEGFRIAVLGEMRELGDQARALHEALARDVATLRDRDDRSVDALAFVGGFSGPMAVAAQAVSDLEVRAFESVEDVVSWLQERGKAVVFLKGSRGSRLERIITGLEERLPRS